ncbi:complement C1q subcomponent subunit B-like [Acanthaster planci]|uniref:Complement C1q subcomponent subunit B-like n=1 Tax=Acanthaster planci TaxID=133434 RepID=A0A8B7ZWU4_ACAPL|nr:complement C1q subcomponent subunit B-like [Acanthaster planci]
MACGSISGALTIIVLTGRIGLSGVEEIYRYRWNDMLKLQMELCFSITLSIAVLLGNSVHLEAAIIGSAPADSDGSLSRACPMCCQGPAGTPGIPGLPGNQGQYGPAGAKGDAGVKGQKGESGPVGDVGNPGKKGDNGMGLPGKVGPRGPPGSVGAVGEVGVKGQKGQPGDTADISLHQVAFTVTRTSHSDPFTSHNTRLPFDQIETLVSGTSFDLATGTFTCNVPGTYVFTFSVCKYNHSGNLWVHLRKNEYFVVTGFSSVSSVNVQVSGSAVLILHQGDSVYLTMSGRTNSYTREHTASFSGFLLYTQLNQQG